MITFTFIEYLIFGLHFISSGVNIALNVVVWKHFTRSRNMGKALGTSFLLRIILYELLIGLVGVLVVIIDTRCPFQQRAFSYPQH